MGQIELTAAEHAALVEVQTAADPYMEPGRLVRLEEIPIEVTSRIFHAWNAIAEAHGLNARACRFQTYPELGRSFVLMEDQHIPDFG